MKASTFDEFMHHLGVLGFWQSRQTVLDSLNSDNYQDCCGWMIGTLKSGSNSRYVGYGPDRPVKFSTTTFTDRGDLYKVVAFLRRSSIPEV